MVHTSTVNRLSSFVESLFEDGCCFILVRFPLAIFRSNGDGNHLSALHFSLHRNAGSSIVCKALISMAAAYRIRPVLTHLVAEEVDRPSKTFRGLVRTLLFTISLGMHRDAVDYQLPKSF